jgi:anti-sigma factor RsiW
MSEIHGATGSYVLHALDPSELDEFEAHLAVCPTCSREVVEFCETAAELSLLAGATPPPALKGSVMAAISNVRVLPPDPELPAANALHLAPAPVPAVRADVTPEAPAEVAARPAPVDELALRRAQRRARILSLAVAAAMVVALAMGGWVVSLRGGQQQVVAPSLETQLYSAPDVTISQFTLKNGAQASFVASKSLNRALLTSSSLPSPGADQTYQLWTLRGQVAIPDNTLGGGNGINQVFSGDIAQATAVALSIEPAGGSQQPNPKTIQTVANL